MTENESCHWITALDILKKQCCHWITEKDRAKVLSLDKNNIRKDYIVLSLNILSLE